MGCPKFRHETSAAPRKEEPAKARSSWTGEFDPDDPDVQAAFAWWNDRLAEVPREVPDLIEAEIAMVSAALPAPNPGANGHLSNGANGKRPD
jgi:hypothetical protein